MNKVFKAGLLCLVVACLVWLVTLWHWQTAGRDVSGGEIVGQLVVLPLLLTAVLLSGLWGVARLRERAAQPVQATASSRSPGRSADVAAQPAQDARHASVAVLHAAVNLSVGSEPLQACMRIRSGEVRPALDPHLQDVEGAPVFTARVADLEVDALRAHMPADVGDRALRALALLQQPMDQLLDKVLAQAELWATERGTTALQQEAGPAAAPNMKAHLSGMAPVPFASARHAAALPRLSVRLAVPATWTEAEREHASAWLRMRCADMLGSDEALREVPPSLHVHALDSPDALWALLDQQTLHWTRDAQPQWCLVLACDSAVDALDIERRQAVGELFTGAHQTGRIPGEAAAGLLLGTLDWPGLADSQPLPARLSRAVRLRRDKSADAIGRVGPAVLQDALRQALAVSEARPEDLSQVVADADHRASRAAELFEALQGLAPELDPMLSVVRIGEVCGDLGMASALVPVALAAGLAQQDTTTGATLAVHVQATHERLAVALLPWTWTPTPAQATT